MTVSTTSESKVKQKLKIVLKKAAVAAFWLLLWEIIYLVVQKEILIVSPAATILRIFSLAATSGFWITALSSLLRIMLGFLTGLAAGVILAAACAALPVLYSLFRPIVSITKATPVASFIILALVWISARQVPTFITSLMVFPIVFGNLYEGIKSVDKNLLEMAKIFRVGRRSQLLHIYLPQIFPYFIAGASTGIGLAWKAGIAAEVLSTPPGSVGMELHNAKIYIETADLFAWTAVVIIFSMALEYLFVFLIKKLTINIRIKPSAPENTAMEPAISALSVSGISKHFGERAVLSDVTVSLPPSGVTALVGPSGSGKTTLLRILAGLEKPDTEPSWQVNRRTAVMFQEDRLLPNATAAENILLVNPAADAVGLLIDMELEDCENMYPKELSGGMRRRVALARTLAYNGDIALLDEPFKGLDAETKSRVAKRVFKRLSGRPVLFITHDPDEAETYASGVIRLPE